MKAMIIKVGTFNEQGQPIGWTFDGTGWAGVTATDTSSKTAQFAMLATRLMS